MTGAHRSLARGGPPQTTNFPSDEPTLSFQVGDKVQRRDGTNAWGTGFVTSLVPLEVTISSTDPSAKGYTWDEVKPL
eukprot:COSAG04_NODE_28_length_36566_cov_70.886665_3_plen_77_part_00